MCHVSALDLSLGSCQVNYCAMLRSSETMEPVLTFGFIGSGQPITAVILWCDGIQSQCTVQSDTPLWPNNLNSAYHCHEKGNKDPMSSAVKVKHYSFTPPVFSRSGDMGYLTTTVYKRLASLLSWKYGQAYSIVVTWLSCHLLFSLMRSTVRYLLEESTVKHWTCCTRCINRGLSCPRRTCAPFLSIV